MTSTISLSSSLSSSLSTASALSALSASSSTQTSRRSHVDVAADALGMSKKDVTTALKSGQSLFDLADAQGVSHDDLVAALKAGAPDEVRNSDDADAMIEALASQTGLSGPGGVSGAGGPRGAGGPGGSGGHHDPPPSQSTSGTTGVLSGTLTSAQQSTLDSLSQLLGTDSSSLLSSLQSGTDLSTLLSNGGVDLDRLSSNLEEGLLVDTRA